MNWITQKKGLIDQYNSKIHKGKMPVRVLHWMNLFLFENSNQKFNKDLENALLSGKISKTIFLDDSDHPIIKPYIRCDSRNIVINETFLSYLWCVCHTVYTLYIQTIDYPSLNKQEGRVRYPISEDIIQKAKDLFSYAKSLILVHDEWNKELLPNPEKYLAEERTFIEQPNMFYNEAVKFILCHEFIHAAKHLDELDKGIDISHYLDFEKEADSEAIKILKTEPLINNEVLKKLGFPEIPLPPHGEFITQIGVIMAILSMFYFKATTDGGVKHPDVEDRLLEAIDLLEIEDTSHCWGILIVGLTLWIEQFNLGLNINYDLSYKEAFYNLIEQIKKLK